MSNSYLNENDELYTDIAIQMFSAHIHGESGAIAELMESYGKSYGDNPTFMPGVVFGFIMHMGILIATLAESTDQSIESVYKSYVDAYNTGLRSKLTSIASLHPDEVVKLMEELGIINDKE
jgi:hypothetical protein